MMKGMRGLRAAAVVAAVVAGGGAAVAAPASAAVIGGCYRYQFASSNLRMTVEDNTEGGRIVQQWAQDGPWFTWCHRAPITTPQDPAIGVFLLQNQATGRCLTTDTVQGHTLTQQQCFGDLATQQWMEWSASYNGQVVWYMTNVASGVHIEVAGDSYAQGAAIIGRKFGSGQLTPNAVMYEI